MTGAIVRGHRCLRGLGVVACLVASLVASLVAVGVAHAADATRPPALAPLPLSSTGTTASPPIPVDPKPNPYRPSTTVISPNAVVEARDAFTQGVQLFHDGKLDASLAAFQKAFDLAPSYRLHYNIAQVEYERHNYVESLRAFWKYLAQGGTDVPPERRTAVKEEIQKLESQVCYLTVKTNVAAAQVAVDDVPIGIAPLTAPVLVNPGVRRISAIKAGHQPAVLTVTATSGAKLHVALELRELVTLPAAALATLPARSSAPSSVHRTKTWISLGSTGALAATTVAFSLATRQAKSDFDDELIRIPNTPQAIEDARSRMRRYAAVADGFGAATVVAAALSVYFALTEGSGSDEPVRERDPSRQAPVLSFTASPNAVGVAGRF